MKNLTRFIFFPAILAQKTFIDPDYISSVDSVECNRIFPFAFESPGSDTNLVDWDLQNFSDNYEKFSTTNSNYAVTTTESYIASCYRDSVGLFCGVTYETERTFKWLRQITDAHPTGKAAIKNSASLIESQPSTSQKYESTNDYRVYVTYETIDQSILVFVSFNYLTGEIENVYRIHKGVTELANTMIMQHIMAAAALDGTSSTSATQPVISLVMSFNSGKAFEIQLSNNGMKNPVPFRLLDYQSKHSVSGVSASGFKNNDFSKVLGISAKGKPQLPVIGQSDVIQPLETIPNVDLQKAVNTMQRKNSAYEYWVFSATAFLTFSVSGSDYLNTIWWYVSRKFENVQQIAEISYTFTSVGGALTSQAVSPDAPQLCMTSENGSGGSFIYIDDISRAAVKPQYLLTATHYACSGLCANFNVDFSQSQLPIGLKQYSVNKPVVCLAINTQMETISTTQGINDPIYTYFSQCKSYTTILLEQKDTGTIHIVQLNFRRSPTFNDQFYTNYYYANYVTAFTHMDCMTHFIGQPLYDFIEETPGLYYKMYSYKINPSESGYQLNSKGLVNFGFYMTWPPTLVLSNEDPNAGQQLSFYVAGVKGKKLTFDTNNLNLRCQSLVSDSSLNLAIVNLPTAADNQAINLSIQNPAYRFLNGAPFQTLTSAVAPLSPLQYQSVAVIDATFLQSVSDPTKDIQYDYSVCTRPKTFGIDPKVQKGLLCLEVNTNLTLNKMNTQGANLIGSGSSVSSMDLNIWPYSNCWDRSTSPLSPINPYPTKPAKQIFSSYFTGWVINSKSVKQADPTNTIKISVESGVSGNTDDQLQLNVLGKVPGTLGLQPERLKMVFKVGADAKNVTWEQKTMFQLSCQPSDLVWQTMQDNRKFPLEVTYFFGQGPMKIALPQTIPTNLLTKYNIDQYQYIAFNYSVLYTSNNTGPTPNYPLSNITIKDQAFVIDQVTGTEQWLMLGAIATSIEPYYYVKYNTNGKVYEDYITINLTSIVNVTFVYNIAPKFEEPLQNVVMSINETVVIKLPDIVDPDSSLAYVQMVLFFPNANFWVLQNTKQKTGSYITLKPSKNSQSGTFFCNIFLIDVSVTPRQSSYGFQIKVLGTVQQPVFVPFIPKNKNAEFNFKPDSGIGIKVEKVFANSTVKLKFNFPMQLYINPLFTDNSNQTTNVTKVLPQYLQLEHMQKDLYSQVVKRMKDPTFQAVSFDGLYLYLLFEFLDANLLSQSATQSTDYIYLKFNETKVFVSQNDLISTQKQWYLDFILPVQQSSLGQAIQTAAQTVSGSVGGIMSANFAINLAMSTSLQKCGVISTFFNLWQQRLYFKLTYHKMFLCYAKPSQA